MAARRDRMAGFCRILAISPRSRACTAAGVSGVTNNPTQAICVRPGKPSSLNVGTSGKLAMRSGDVTANALMLLLCTSGTEVAGPSNISCTWLPMMSCKRGR